MRQTIHRHSPTRALVVALFALVVLGVLTAAAVGADAPPRGGVARGRARSSAEIVGGSPAQRSLLSAILARFGVESDLQLRLQNTRGGVELTSPRDGIREVWNV